MPGIEPPDPKAQPLLRLIVEAIDRGRIREGDPRTFLSYSEALGFLGRPKPLFRPGTRLQKVGLNALNEWTLEHRELPKIAALIVNKKTHRPSSGFAESHGHRTDNSEWETWWMEEANRAINYDWKPFLAPITRYRREAEEAALDLIVKEDEESEAPDYRAIITVEPGKRGGRPCIRGMRITVGDILGWLAAGMSERKIIEEFSELTHTDIHAALAFAADREKELAKPTFAERWRGKFKLPKPDPDDARLTYLLERYHRSDA